MNEWLNELCKLESATCKAKQHKSPIKKPSETSAKVKTAQLVKPFAPFGDLYNVHKGLKAVKKKLKTFHIDFAVPIQKQKCKFLKGKDPDFVVREAKMKPNIEEAKKQKKKEKPVLKEINMTVKEVTRWINERRNTRSCGRSNPMKSLRRELSSSASRLRSAKMGRTIEDCIDTPAFITSIRNMKMSQSVKRPHTGYSRNFGTIDNKRAQNAKTFYDTLDANQTPLNLSLVTSNLTQPYLKLFSLTELSRRIRENSILEFSKMVGRTDSSEKCAVKRYLELIDKECRRHSKQRLSTNTQPAAQNPAGTPLSRATAVSLKGSESKEDAGRKLEKALCAQNRSRPTTVSYKKASFSSFKGSATRYGSNFYELKLKAEKIKVRNYKELAQRYGSVYYALAKFVLLNEWEHDPAIVGIMDYYKGVVEYGGKFTKGNLKECVTTFDLTKGPANK